MDAVTSAIVPRGGVTAPGFPEAEPPAPFFNPTDTKLLRLGRLLKERGYRFTTIAPASHARVIARPLDRPPSLADIFGWSRPFHLRDVDPEIARYASAASVLETQGSWTRSWVRFSTLADQLYVHSAYPTEQPDAVFFGPDTYRFCRVIKAAFEEIRRGRDADRPLRILDVGTGSGAGGLYAAARAAPMHPVLTLSDINSRALRYCRVNSVLNGFDNVRIVESDLFEHLRDRYDLIIANPPYLIDKLERTYRHGGGSLGSALSLRILMEGSPHLAIGGRLVLYTGSAIVDGRDYFQDEISSWARQCALPMTYEEIDPDVFGEELDHPPYDCADRIAAVSVVVDLPRR